VLISFSSLLAFSLPFAYYFTLPLRAECGFHKILTAKKGDRHVDTSELEKECDRLVYKLYQLTYDEVKIN
jgi:hypothetical protein